jgi:HAE1 family hydrophobic/amphiphilic exporter-1
MKLSEICVRRPVFAVMLISFLVVLGLFSFRDLGVDLFPKADMPTVTVNIQLPGASPEEVTTQVVQPLEEAISSISGLDELRAMVSEGNARITVQFVLDRNIESAAQDVREKVAGAMRRLPPTVLPPVIQKADPDSAPVIAMAVVGDRTMRELTEIADKQVRRALETVDGVGEVSMSGGRERQIRILLDADKLAAYRLTPQQVEEALVQENVETPGGRLVRGDTEFGVRTLGRIDAAAEFGNIIVANIKGAPIRMHDIARVEDSHGEIRTYSAINDQEAVVLEVRRQTGTNTVKIVDAVKAKMTELRRVLPAGVRLQIISDDSVFIKASVKSLEEHLLLGSLLASLVVLLFIGNLRTVFIAALAIPTSIIATFTLMRYMDFTLNNMSLLGLTLAVGIVIDDAIIVLENIYRFIEEKGYAPKVAAVEATKEIGLAVMATTLSLVIIFIPIAFMTGYARRFVNQFGWTMAMAIMVSLLVSFTLTPMASSLLLRATNGNNRRKGNGSETEPGPLPTAHSPQPTAHHARSKEAGFFRYIDAFYGRALNWALDHRFSILLICALTLASTVVLNKHVGRDWIPTDDQSEFQIITDFPEGTSFEGTIRPLKEIAARARKLPGVEYVYPRANERMGHAHLYVHLVAPDKRDLNSEQVGDLARKLMTEYPYIRGRVMLPSALGMGEQINFPISLNILGPDLRVLADLAKNIAIEMKKRPELTDVDVGLNLNNPELQVRIDRQRASDLGVRVSDVAGAVRLFMSGEDEISTYKEGAEQYPVTMQLLYEQRDNPQMLARLVLPSSRLGQVRLDSVATIQRGAGPVRIDRYNRQFSTRVSGNVAGDSALDAAARVTLAAVRKVSLPPGYSTRFSGQVKIMDETSYNLLMALLLASIFMYMVLAAQFESLLHPFIIMLTLPLSIPFALLSLWATGRSLNLWSALGVLLLLGIVKKNGILQIDYSNRLRAAGLPLRQAIVEANHVRLRPILMTTFSIVAGLIPTALGIGVGSAQRSAIAVTIIGGQTLCLLLTLLVVPVTYEVFEEAREALRQAPLRARLARATVGATRVLHL